MKKNLITAVLMTLVTTVLFGLLFPLLVTGLAQVLFPKQANGELLTRNNHVVGSRLIGQQFSSPGYFHSRPSSAGTGYDAGNSGGSNLGPTNQSLIARVRGDADRLRAENPGAAIPMDLLTTSGSGLDPHISPEAAEFQVSAHREGAQAERRRGSRGSAPAYGVAAVRISRRAAGERPGIESHAG